MKIAGRKISLNKRPYIIAEISANHQQSYQRAVRMIKSVKDIGADAVKLQMFDLNEMTLNCDGTGFVIKDKSSPWHKKKLYNLYKEAVTPKNWYKKIYKLCKEIKITCFSSVFDIPSLNFLDQFNPPAYKVASFENNHFPLIEEIAKRNKPVIISTGMTNMKNLIDIKKIFKKYKNNKLAFLKCTSSYPANPKDSNLLAINQLRKKFKCEIGLSDHTNGIGAAVASIPLGASIIEKHIVLKKMDGSLDEKFSLDPKGFKRLITEARTAWEALGKNKIFITKREKKLVFLKRSIYVCENVKKNEKSNKKNLKIIRPGYGLNSKFYKKILNKRFKKSFKKGTPLKFNMLKK